MTDEQRILESIGALRSEVRPLVSTARAMDGLRRDLAPRVEEAVRALILELADVESDFQIEDLLYLLKKSMRNVRNFNKALDQFRGLIGMVENLEPLIRQSVPVWITYLDELERNGVFGLMKSFLDVLAKAAAAYGEEDLQRMGDGLVALMGLARGLADPRAAALLERLAAVPARVDLEAVRPVGPMALLGALGDPDLRRGLGLALELGRALGREPAPAAETTADQG